MNEKVNLILQTNSTLLARHYIEQELQCSFCNTTLQELELISRSFSNILAMKTINYKGKLIYVFYANSIGQAKRKFFRLHTQHYYSPLTIGVAASGDFFVFNLRTADVFFDFVRQHQH